MDITYCSLMTELEMFMSEEYLKILKLFGIKLNPFIVSETLDLGFIIKIPGK